MLTVRPLRGALWKGRGEEGSKPVTVLPLLFPSIRDLWTKIMRLVWPSWTHSKRTGTENRPAFNGRTLLVLSGLCKVRGWIKVSCAAPRCGIVLLVAQLPLSGNITWQTGQHGITLAPTLKWLMSFNIIGSLINSAAFNLRSCSCANIWITFKFSCGCNTAKFYSK